MNASLLWIPFILARFGLMALLHKTALKRAAHFPAMVTRGEKAAYVLYQLSNIAIFVCMFFLQVKFTPMVVFYIGCAIYIIGIILLITAVIAFAFPLEEGLNVKGIYAFSRNPMYVAYFVFFIGCVVLTQSLVLCGLVLLFQITAHFIILAEERWCLAVFGEAYRQYMVRVRRYF